MSRSELLDALLDKPQYQSLYLHSTSFHASIDMILGMIPGWISSMATQALEDEKRREAAIRAIESEPVDFDWVREPTEEKASISLPEEMRDGGTIDLSGLEPIGVLGIEMNDDAMTVIHEIQAEAEADDPGQIVWTPNEVMPKPVSEKYKVKGRTRAKPVPQPPATKRRTASTKKATPVKKTATKTTKAQKKSVPRTSRPTKRQRYR